MAEPLWKTIHSAAAAGPDCRLRAHASRSPLRLAVVGADAVVVEDPARLGHEPPPAAASRKVATSASTGSFQP